MGGDGGGGESRILHWIVLLLGALFVVSALLQLNDPDPVRWIAIYLVAGLVCFLPRGRTSRRWLASCSALVSWGWAAWLAPSALPGLAPADLVKKMEAKTPRIELGREDLGLAILAVVLTCVAVAEWRRARSAPR